MPLVPTLTRRKAMLTGVAAAGLGLAVRAPAVAAEAASYHLGKDDAPHTLVEYASLTCPHCAEFTTRILPQLKAKYIDPGKIKYVYRDFPLDRVALDASVLARCLPKERYFPFVETLFETQRSWATAADPRIALKRYSKLAGLSEEQATKCLDDKSLQDAVLAERLEAQNKYQVSATPTLILDGKKLENGSDFGAYDRQIQTLIGAS